MKNQTNNFMQCFIPYTDDLLDKMPNFKQLTLVPFIDEYIDYVMEYEVCENSGKTHWNKVVLAKKSEKVTNLS